MSDLLHIYAFIHILVPRVYDHCHINDDWFPAIMTTAISMMTGSLHL